MLTRFAKGSIREIIAVSFPLLLSLLSACIMSFCDRYLISKYSLEAFKGVGYGGYLALLFQALCIKITSINQVFVSTAIGKMEKNKVGPFTWQMIWCSIFSTLIVVPVGLMIRPFYFTESLSQQYGLEYFTTLLFGNWLFALGGAFSGYQSGIGKTKVLAITALVSNICNLILNYLLIFGIKEIFPPMGVRGAALGTLFSQGLSCLILFISFFWGRNRIHYKSRSWIFSPALSWTLLKLGIPRALARSAALFYWILSVKLLGKLDGDYLLTLSYGATLWLVISSITEALGKGMISIFSYFIGSQEWEYVKKSFSSALVLLLLSTALLTLLVFNFSDSFISSILNHTVSHETMNTLKLATKWICVYFFLEGVVYIEAALLAGMKSTLFTMFFNLFAGGFTIFLPYYICFQIYGCGADKIWMANWICCVAALGAFFIKAYSLRKKHAGTFKQTLT